jgi:hypothetical protein
MSKPSGTESLSHNTATLENLFFAKKDAQLLSILRADQTLEQRKSVLHEITSLSAETINQLIENGIDQHTLKAVSLIPLLAVAWADHRLDQNEATSILRAAQAEGIEDGSNEYKLLKNWLKNEPGPSLLQAWKHWIAELVHNLSADEVQSLKVHVLKLTQKVAEADGGFLGFASVSAKESGILQEIESAFSTK